MNIRTANPDDIAAIADLEARSFPELEAARPEAIAARVAVFPDHFWLLEDEGQLVSFLNGMATDQPTIQDEMFENPQMHKEDGAWQAVFGLCSDPAYKGRGYAAHLMRHVLAEIKRQGRRGCVLTCKEELIPYYERLGFKNFGLSASKHGGEVWYDMVAEFE